MDHLLVVLLLLWSSGLQAEGAQCETSAKADIVLVLDGSSSISPTSFQDVRSFVTNIVSAFDIGPDRVQIALVQYSSQPTTHWYLNTHQNKQDLLDEVSRTPLLGGGTNTGRALKYILQNIFQPNVGMRANSEKIAVLITDGHSSDNVDSPSQALKDAGIEVYTVGFNTASETELRAIASDPDENHVFIVQNSDLLRDIVDNLTINLCDSTKSSDSVRLVNGTSLCSGRLEVKTDQSNQSNQWWSLVCEADFDQRDAEVVCRELGCGAPSVLWGALYGEVEAPMLTKEFQCEGSESALLDCRSSGSATNTCSPGKAVGLTCSEPVRLVGGSRRCAGALEVKQGDWRPVYDSNWTLTSAAVVCRELHCGSVVSTGLRNESTLQSSWEIRPDCVQSGSALRECVSPMWSSFFLEVTCSGPTVSYIRAVRLVLLSLGLLLLITVVCVTHQTTRGQKPDLQEPMELDYYNLGVHRAEEEGGEAAE